MRDRKGRGIGKDRQGNGSEATKAGQCLPLLGRGGPVLVLDRGRDVKHGEYPTATKDIWEFPYGGRATAADLQHQEVRELLLRAKRRIRLRRRSCQLLRRLHDGRLRLAERRIPRRHWAGTVLKPSW